MSESAQDLTAAGVVGICGAGSKRNKTCRAGGHRGAAGGGACRAETGGCVGVLGQGCVQLECVLIGDRHLSYIENHRIVLVGKEL